MMQSEVDILEKLTEALSADGVSPIPDSKLLLERIRARMQVIQSLKSTGIEVLVPQIGTATSPVCFATSEEVQAAYKTENSALEQIDGCIDRLIMSQES
ncbi:hypothetical protein SYJ56_11480 [Algoriphagus sp. D3-2-R+10]|uniref:hypothetical protein n=1 Tax=Algoriphagus aurantiacus TaxID=3103948 RepID=UPI002B3C6B15|nr:hypothetical protein [Algoriphagus sp. D3-2-R+10]MEB2775931.1 hypothetical protein [Algoriphagus sp. D3-2-R+10]